MEKFKFADQGVTNLDKVKKAFFGKPKKKKKKTPLEAELARS